MNGEIMNNNYTITHIHSTLSNGTTNIDSVTNFRDYVKCAKDLGMRAMAFTEHGNIFEWVHKKEEIENAGMKYIHAVEAYITESLDEKVRDNYHCCLYAKNYEGVKEINSLLSKSYNRKDGHFYYMPRISFDELIKTSNNIIISTACLGGILHKGNDIIREKFICFLMKNKDRCFLEIQHHSDTAGDQKKYNQYLYELSKTIGVPLISGTDTHALNDIHLESRSILQKAKKVFFADEESWDLTLKSYDELIAAYKKQNSLPMDVVIEAIENTNKLADMVETFELDRSYKYPHLWDNPMDTFMSKIHDGIKRRGVDKYPNYQEYLDRIEYELKAYVHNQAIDFMLLMEDIISWCLAQDIQVGYGRGSVNGSIIAWLLGITEMDSIKHGLNFDRFMNVERVSLSDIDTDFPPSRIEEVKQYIFNKTGLYCCDIVTFNTVADKGAIRDVGRALEIPLSEVSEICSAVDNQERYEIIRGQYKKLFQYVDSIKGTIVSVGSHPCFAENELVLTTNGYKKIKDVVPGDYVITHTGKAKEVCEVMKNHSDDIYTVKTAILPIQATGNHPFYVRDKHYSTWYDNPIWKPVNQIQKGDMLGTPVNTNSIIPMYNEYSLDFSNKDLWWLIGRYIGNGCITNINKSQFVICCNPTNDDTGEIVRRLAYLKFTYIIQERESVNRVYVENKDLCEYLRKYDRYADGKVLINDVINLPIHLLKSFIFGYLRTGDYYNEKKREYRITMYNSELTLGFFICIAKAFRTCPRVKIREEHGEFQSGKQVCSKEIYKMYFCIDRTETKHGFYENGYIWTHCYGTKKENKDLDTYNLSVYDDNSYTVNNIAVHNCGAVVAPHNIDETFGTFTSSTSNYPISQINMKEIDSLNYVKLDLLRLDTIELINETCKLAGIERLTPDNVDISDIKVWNAIRDDTTQIFQWEGNTGNSYIKKLLSENNISKFQKVNKNVDRMTLLSIGNSAIRPAGASYRDDLANGVVRKSGSDAIDEFLKPTFGYLVFQCQIIEFLHSYCGFTMGEADIVRRHFAKKTGTDKDIPIIKDGGYMNNKSDHYIPGFIATMKGKYGMQEDDAENAIVAFLQVIIDASEYLFSINHSAPYSYEGYVSGYLRTYYPVEFLTTALNINKDKEEKTSALIAYAKKVGINIRPPRFRHSQSGYLCDKAGNSIYKGIESIKYMNKGIADDLYALRDNIYETFVELLYDIKSKTSLDSRQLDILIKIDFFEEFGDINKILYIRDKFDLLYGKTQIKKDKIKELGIPEEIIRKYSDKETDNIVKEIDYMKYLADKGMIFENEVDIEDELEDCFKYSYKYIYTEEQNRRLEHLQNQIIDDSPFIDDECEIVKAEIKEIRNAAQKIKVANGYNHQKIIAKYEMTDDEVEQYATKKTYGRFEGINTLAILRTLFDNCDIKPITTSQRIKYQIEHLGYVEYYDPDADKRLIVILNLDTTYTPKFEAYSIKTGNICTMKIHNRIPRGNKNIKTCFSDIPVNNGDIIYMTKCSKEPKKKKAPDGSWTTVPGEYWWYIDEYRKILNI